MSFVAGKHFEIIVKSYQSSYWQAAVTGVNQEAAKLGLDVHCTGPNAESDIADQVNMLNSAINSSPAGIGLAACDQNACLDALQTAMEKGIPVICFDSGIPNAPKGSVLATIATDNYGADIIIEVVVPAQTTADICATEASVILNKSDTIGIFGSNQIAAEGILTSDENLGVLGSDPAKTILAAGFDAGSVIKEAVRSRVMYEAVTQSPLMMGITTVQTLKKIADGEKVSDIYTDGYWYNAKNMDDPSIAPNLYD